MTNGGEKASPGLIGPHGGYRELKSYQNAEIVYDTTVKFCERFVNRYSRTTDQMVQAARSGKQNIAEGSMASGTSRKTELKLVGIARASLEELLLDYQDFLRQRGLALWEKNHPTAPLSLIHQTNFLLDRQLSQLEQRFLNEGGFTEKLYQARNQARKPFGKTP
jgi:four helix bundle suffix protein